MKHKKTTFLMIMMASVLCVMLTACFSSNPKSSSEQSASSSTSTQDQSEQPNGSGTSSDADQSDKSDSTSASVPYTIHIARSDISVYEGPGYDYGVVDTVGAAGTYTIVEEEVDYEGIRWGKLKSGLGWIDIAAAESSEGEPAPIQVRFADEKTLNGGKYEEFIADDSEHMVKLLFIADEVLTNVQFSLLAPGDTSAYDVTETLYTMDQMTPDMPFVAGVVFYGDMTSYGISFTDAEGQEHHFATYISGRNGSLVLDEYTP